MKRVRPVEARFDQLSDGAYAFFAHRDEAAVARKTLSGALDLLVLGVERRGLGLVAGDVVAGHPVEQRQQRHAAQQGEHRVGGALRAAASDRSVGALVSRNQVDGSHCGTSAAARPAATASRCVETRPARLSSATATAAGCTSTPSDACSASAKPGRSSTRPLSTTRVTSPPPPCERWKSSELRTSLEMARTPFSSTKRASESFGCEASLGAGGGSVSGAAAACSEGDLRGYGAPVSGSSCAASPDAASASRASISSWSSAGSEETTCSPSASLGSDACTSVGSSGPAPDLRSRDASSGSDALKSTAASNARAWVRGTPRRSASSSAISSNPPPTTRVKWHTVPSAIATLVRPSTFR